MNPFYPEVALRARHRCEYCRAPEAVFNFPFEVEHIVPASRGGSKSESNAALSCRACNLHKAAHVTGADSETTEEVRLFNPRADSWAEHFQFDPKHGAIVGVTPIGRGTVARLQLNSEAQMAARLQWMRLEIFP